MKTNNTMQHILRLTLTLLVICAVVAAVLAGVNMITKDKIADNIRAEKNAAIQEIFPESDENQLYGEPVEGIRAVVDAYFSWTDGAGNHYRKLDYTDTLYTDSSGMVQRKTGLFDKSSDVTVTLTDVDGEKNGSFEEKVMEGLQMTQVKKGDDSWYNGAYELKFEATLKKKD